MNAPGHGAIRLSAAMMVKDEEATLSRCLSAIRDIVDEIIIVDTGSKDRTIEIGRSFDAIIYEHPWQGDFSLHRNQSISYCTGDWILIIDADEELIIPQGQDIREALANISDSPTMQEADAAAVTLINYSGADEMSRFITPRFFKRGTIAYEGKVHNQTVGRPACIILEGPELKHYGYDRSSPNRELKFQRSLALMEEALRQDPTDYRMMFHLCQLFTDHGQLDEAVKYGNQYIQFREKTGEDFNPTIYYTLAGIALNRGDVQESRHYIMDGLKTHPDYIDLWFVGIKMATLANEARLAGNMAHEYMDLHERYRKDPTMMARQFVQTFNVKSLAYAAYSSAMAGMYQAMQGFDIVARALPHLQEDYRKELISGIVQSLEMTTLPGATKVNPMTEAAAGKSFVHMTATGGVA